MPASAASRALCDAAVVLAGGARTFAEVLAARRALADSAEIAGLVDDLLLELGYDAARTRVDAPRLRCVTSGGHREPAAAPAYAAHRDTWFGNPRAQVNLWLPLADVDADSTFAIHPAYFGRAVPNSSGHFRVDALAAAGGFGVGASAPEHHPTVVGDFDRSGAVRVVCRRADVVAFAAAHLHETLPQDTGRTRRSIDIRVVDERDVPVPDVDDACVGRVRYRRVGETAPTVHRR